MLYCPPGSGPEECIRWMNMKFSRFTRKGLQKTPFTYRSENGILLGCFWKILKKFFGRGFREIATSIKNPRIPVFRNAGKENMMILWNLFWGNCVCQHSSVKVIVLRRQANHNAVPTNTNRKTNQTSVFRGPANSLLTEYPIQHRIRHHIGKQLRL